jgi:hypothetical protein
MAILATSSILNFRASFDGDDTPLMSSVTRLSMSAEKAFRSAAIKLGGSSGATPLKQHDRQPGAQSAAALRRQTSNGLLSRSAPAPRKAEVIRVPTVATKAVAKSVSKNTPLVPSSVRKLPSSNEPRSVSTPSRGVLNAMKSSPARSLGGTQMRYSVSSVLFPPPRDVMLCYSVGNVYFLFSGHRRVVSPA